MLANLSGESFNSLKMRYVEHFEKEFCKKNDRIENGVENGRKREVLMGEILN